MPRVPRSVLRRSVFAVDGSEGDEQRSKRHRESGDRLRRTAGLHLPIQSKGAKCDSRRPKIFRFARRIARYRTRKPLTFNIKGAHFSKSQKTQKQAFHSGHFAPLCAVALPTPWPIGGRCTHRQADRPLPHLAAAAPALPVATRKTTRLSCQSPLLFVQNAPPFATPPHAGDTTRALASALQSRCFFLPSPFTFTPTRLIYKCLRVNFILIFCFTEVKAKGVKPSHLSSYCPTIYTQQVKK